MRTGFVFKQMGRIQGTDFDSEEEPEKIPAKLEQKIKSGAKRLRNSLSSERRKPRELSECFFLYQ